MATGLVNGIDTLAQETGHSAFRFLIPTDKFEEAGIHNSLHIDEDTSIKIAVNGEQRLVWYPCRE